MATYRIYWLGEDDRIKSADYIEFASDADALAKAQELIDQSAAVEIWQGKCCVARLNRSESTRQPLSAR